MSVPLPASASYFDVILPASPYPGLRPFQKHEWPIFFGRERMIDEVIGRLIRQQLLVVHGDSGCGKSSLINAGVLARLEQDNARGGLTWRTCSTQPREAPMWRLAQALASLDGRDDDEARVVEIRRMLNFGSKAPRALMKQLRRGESDHICVLIDQFEELFAFARKSGPDEARVLIQFLVAVLEDPPPGLYVVLTMRSEFLGVCAQFPGLAEAVNQTQYLLPKMARLDLLRAIREPAPLYGGHVSAHLAQRLIADAGGTQDELPLIQHGLMVLYRDKAIVSGEPWRLELTDYAEGPGLAQLLSGHADRVADDADPSGIVVQKLFRALTEINAEGQAIRRPQQFGALLDVTGAEETTLGRVIDAFRHDSVSFLTPYAEQLSRTLQIDISHEALIRSWRRIAHPEEGWLALEFQDGLIWKSLLVQAQSFRRNLSNVLSGPTAVERQEWLAHRNAAWAERYGGGWERVKELVDASETARRAAEAAEEAKTRRLHQLGSALVVLLFVVLVGVIWYSGRLSREIANTYDERAAVLWNRLDFSDRNRLRDTEMNALWEVASGNPGVRTEFIEHLMRDPELAITLGRRPLPVIRAMFLRWPPERAIAALRHVAETITRTTDSTQLANLGAAARALAATMPASEAYAAARIVSSTLSNVSDGNRLTALVPALQELATTLTAAEARELLETILKLVQNVTVQDPRRIVGRFQPVCEGLSARLDTTQASALLPTVLKQVSATTTTSHISLLGKMSVTIAGKLTESQARGQFDATVALLLAAKNSDQFGAFRLTTVALAGRFTSQEARTTLFSILKRLSETPDKDYEHRAALATLTQVLSAKINSTAAQTVFSSLATAIQGTTSSDELSSLGSAAEAVAANLPVDDIPAALSLLSGTVTNTDQLVALASAVHGLVGKVSAEQAEPVLSGLLRAIGATVNTETLEKLGDAARTVAAKVTQEQASAMVTRVFAAIPLTSDRDQLSALALTGQALADRISVQSTPAVFSQILTGVRSTTDRQPLSTLGSVAQALAVRLTPAQAQSALSSVLSAITRLSDVDQLRALGIAAAGLSSTLPPDQAREWLQRVLRLARELKDPDQVDALAVTATTLIIRIDADQAPTVLQSVLASINRKVEREQYVFLAKASAALAARLNPEQAQDAFSFVLMASGRTSNTHRLVVYTSAADALAAKLGGDYPRSAFPEIFAAILRATDPEQREGLRRTAQALARKLSAPHARAAFPTVLKAMTASSEEDLLASLALVAEAFAPHVTPEQAVSALQPLLHGISKTTQTDILRGLGAAGQALGRASGADDAFASMQQVFELIPTLTDGDQLEALASIAVALGGRVSTGRAQKLFGQAIDTIAVVTDSDQLNALRRGATSLVAKLPARASLSTVLPKFVAATEKNRIDALGSTVLALAAAANVQDVQADLARILKAMTSTGSVTTFMDPGSPAAALTTKLTPDQAQRIFLSLLAWSGSSAEATMWAKALVAKLPHDHVESSVAVIAQALKYPTTTAAETTDALLEGLSALDRTAPGKNAGLEKNLAWIQSNYSKTIDLTARPQCPAPPSPDLICPTTDRAVSSRIRATAGRHAAR